MFIFTKRNFFRIFILLSIFILFHSFALAGMAQDSSLSVLSGVKTTWQEQTERFLKGIKIWFNPIDSENDSIQIDYSALDFRIFAEDSIHSEEFSEKPKDTLWRFHFGGGFNLAQTAMVNWASGGENSVSGDVRVNAVLIYKTRQRSWITSFKTDYGLMYTKTNGWNKTLDELNFFSKFGYAIPSGKWYYTAAIDFKTQLDKGYQSTNDENYISKIMAPAYFNMSVGMDYKPFENMSFYVSPFTSRTTFVLDTFLSNKGAFGVKPGQKNLWQAGPSFNFRGAFGPWKNIGFVTFLGLFTPYGKTFGNFVVDWDLQINFTINRYLKASVSTSLKYDEKIKTTDKNGTERGPKVQFKEIIAVGFLYTFKAIK